MRKVTKPLLPLTWHGPEPLSAWLQRPQTGAPRHAHSHRHALQAASRPLLGRAPKHCPSCAPLQRCLPQLLPPHPPARPLQARYLLCAPLRWCTPTPLPPEGGEREIVPPIPPVTTTLGTTLFLLSPSPCDPPSSLPRTLGESKTEDGISKLAMSPPPPPPPPLPLPLTTALPSSAASAREDSLAELDSRVPETTSAFADFFSVACAQMCWCARTYMRLLAAACWSHACVCVCVFCVRGEIQNCSEVPAA